MTEKQVKSKQRVADHGEVFTAEREVNAMLDLVKNETERIESRFLEPACGDGNFLAEILRRKLAVVQRKYGGARMHHDYEMWSMIAVMNIYGVELLPDNAAACRERLFNICTHSYLVIGSYGQSSFSENVLGYIRTNFVRFLILQAMTSIHLTKATFSFVPMQDFSKPWTDEELYAKYGLTDEEIAFIESMIKPME